MIKHNHFRKNSKRAKAKHINDLSPDLRGPSQNKHGGHQTQRMRGFRGNTYGPASAVRKFTKEEIAAYEQQMRETGRV